ncbi:hypothetical protein Plhal304r1_c023g0078531 [Plasmopara halstedii]
MIIPFELVELNPYNQPRQAYTVCFLLTGHINPALAFRPFERVVGKFASTTVDLPKCIDFDISFVILMVAIDFTESLPRPPTRLPPSLAMQERLIQLDVLTTRHGRRDVIVKQIVDDRITNQDGEFAALAVCPKYFGSGCPSHHRV